MCVCVCVFRYTLECGQSRLFQIHTPFQIQSLWSVSLSPYPEENSCLLSQLGWTHTWKYWPGSRLIPNLVTQRRREREGGNPGWKSQPPERSKDAAAPPANPTSVLYKDLPSTPKLFSRNLSTHQPAAAATHYFMFFFFSLSCFVFSLNISDSKKPDVINLLYTTQSCCLKYKGYCANCKNNDSKRSDCLLAVYWNIAAELCPMQYIMFTSSMHYISIQTLQHFSIVQWNKISTYFAVYLQTAVSPLNNITVKATAEYTKENITMMVQLAKCVTGQSIQLKVKGK